MEKMEVQLANLTAWVQTAVVTGSSRESSIRSGASTTPSDLGDSKPPSVVGSKLWMTVLGFILGMVYTRHKITDYWYL